MTLEQSMVAAIRDLPLEKQREVLDRANQLRRSTGEKRPRKSGRGLWADLGISLSADAIDEIRREMWERFPRDEF